MHFSFFFIENQNFSPKYSVRTPNLQQLAFWGAPGGGDRAHVPSPNPVLDRKETSEFKADVFFTFIP